MQLGAGARRPRVMLLPPMGGVSRDQGGKRRRVGAGLRVLPAKCDLTFYCRPLVHCRSKTKLTHTQRESAPYGTILSSRQNKDRKNDCK